MSSITVPKFTETVLKSNGSIITNSRAIIMKEEKEEEMEMVCTIISISLLSRTFFKY
jgi:hypothetical protein